MPALIKAALQTSKQLRECSADELAGLVNEILGLLNIRADNNNSQNLQQMSASMVLYLKQEYPYLRIDELRIAYRLYIKGELGIEVFRLFDPVSVGSVLKAYQAYKTALPPQSLSIPHPEPPPPTPEQIEQIMVDGFIRAYQQVCQHGDFDDWGNAIYDWLEQSGRYAFSKQKKTLCYQQALEAIHQQEKATAINTAMPGSRRKKAVIRAGEVLAVIEKRRVADMPLKEQAVWQAKQILLKKLLTGLAEQKIAPEQFLSDHPPTPPAT